jgi:hypothetical protein
VFNLLLCLTCFPLRRLRGAHFVKERFRPLFILHETRENVKQFSHLSEEMAKK